MIDWTRKTFDSCYLIELFKKFRSFLENKIFCDVSLIETMETCKTRGASNKFFQVSMGIKMFNVHQ